MRILLIDDDPDTLHIARYALEKLGGHHVECAANGAEALARDEPLDVIVLDVMLPDIDAPALIAGLRERRHRETPIILLTARRVGSETYGPGVVGFVEKPFDPLTLGTEIERLVQGTA